MKKPRSVDVSAAVRNEPAMRSAIQRATLEARQRHKQAGLPVAEWRDGKVVWVPADQIEEAKPARKSKSKIRASARAAKR